MDRSTQLANLIPFCALLLSALFFVCIGLRGVVRRTPFVLSTTWSLALVGIVFAAQLVALAVSAKAAKMSVLSQVGPLAVIFALGAVFVWRVTRGYVAYGVTNTSLHEGLRASLESLGLASEERFGAVRIEAMDTNIVAASQRAGIASVRIEDTRHRGVLREVAAGMNRYYAASNTKAVRAACYFNLAFGLALAALAVYCVVRRLHSLD